MACKLKMMIAGSVVGRPCPECSHVDLVHPGSGRYNKDVTECLVCALNEALNDFKSGKTARIRGIRNPHE